MSDRYAGLAELKTEGGPALFDRGSPVDAAAERVRKSALNARRAGRSAAINKESPKCPPDFKAWERHWRAGFVDGRREPGFYWVVMIANAADAWQPAQWDGDRWWVIGNDVELTDVAQVGRRLRKPGTAS